MLRDISLLSGVLLLLSSSIKAQDIRSDKPLETVADLGRHMAIGLSVSSGNRVFAAFPNHDGEGKWALVEISGEKAFKPFPDEEWNKKDKKALHHWTRIQDLFVDARDNLWVLESMPGSTNPIEDIGNGNGGFFRLSKVNVHTKKIEAAYTFDNLDKTQSALNDVRVDPHKNLAYLSDPGLAAIVVLDLETGKARPLLAETKYTLADKTPLKYGGKEMKDQKGTPFISNVNGIALSRDFKYLYFKPINKENLYRIETKYLADPGLEEDALENHVTDMGKVGVTHGLITDKKGNIYLSSSEEYAIRYLDPQGKLHVLIHDNRILWPDSMGIGEDGYLYFTCAQLQLLPHWNNGIDKTKYPYRIFRVRL